MEDSTARADRFADARSERTRERFDAPGADGHEQAANSPAGAKSETTGGAAEFLACGCCAGFGAKAGERQGAAASGRRGSAARAKLAVFSRDRQQRRRARRYEKLRISGGTDGRKRGCEAGGTFVCTAVCGD